MVHALTAYCFKIHFAILPWLLVLPSCCLVSGIPTKPSVHSVLYTCCMPRPFLPPFDPPDTICWTVQISTVCIIQFVVMSGCGCVSKCLGCSQGGGSCFCFYCHIPTSFAPPLPFQPPVHLVWGRGCCGWGHTLWSAEIMCAAAVPLSRCAWRHPVSLFLVHSDILQPMCVCHSNCQSVAGYLWLLWCTDRYLSSKLPTVSTWDTNSSVLWTVFVLSYPTVWTPVMAVMHPSSQVRAGQRESFTATRNRTYKVINPFWFSLRDPVRTAQ
jgi:hypothetical protein